jgi:aspartate racemase
MRSTEHKTLSRTVGILGGMGPAATIEFFRRLVAATPAAIDQAHLRILIDNNPHVPDRSEAIFGRGESPAPALADMARGLARAGADFLTMPCNTAHVFQSAIRDAVSIPFIDMIEETAEAVHAKRAGLLATTGTVRTELYRSACARRGIDVVLPDDDDQELVMDIIRRIKAGGSAASVREHAAAIVRRLAARGADVVIAGCTEISLIPGAGMPIPWIDALDCLVNASMRAALDVSKPCRSQGEP